MMSSLSVSSAAAHLHGNGCRWLRRRRKILATLNNKMKAVGGFIGALVIPAALPNAVPGVRFINYVPAEGSQPRWLISMLPCKPANR